MITAGQGREAAFSAAVLGDNVLMEKAWQEVGTHAETVLHAHAHGRPSLKDLLELWNKFTAYHWQGMILYLWKLCKFSFKVLTKHWL